MYLKHLLTSFSLALLLLLHGCGGGSSSDTSSTQSFTLDEKQFVHNLFLTEYLWYEDVPQSIDYARYSTPQSLIDALRVNPPDRWSFMLTQQQYEDFVNQKTAGFGFGYTQDYTIYMVRIGAPAWQKLQRGDRIITINGEEVTDDLIHTASQNLGSETIFTLDRNGTTLDIKVTPREYTFEVTQASTIDYNGKKVGYLRYDSFTSTSVEEIEQAFDSLKSAGIEVLIIDLRYNGGGAVTVSSILLDNIHNSTPGQRQFYLDWNANYQQNNETYYFEDADEQDGNELNVSKVYFLVTKNSASASELVISALKPYLGESNIITIGDYTHGKNVGMRGRVYGTDYYFLINFYVRNNAGETTSFDGISPTCTATDDLTHLRGDPAESMLQTALIHFDTGTCP